MQKANQDSPPLPETETPTNGGCTEAQGLRKTNKYDFLSFSQRIQKANQESPPLPKTETLMLYGGCKKKKILSLKESIQKATPRPFPIT